jgi:hypothetical protein
MTSSPTFCTTQSPVQFKLAKPGQAAYEVSFTLAEAHLYCRVCVYIVALRIRVRRLHPKQASRAAGHGHT